MKFSDWMESRTMVSRLAVFDFDKTLANTAEPPPNWPRDKDWWDHEESLEPPYFQGFNPEVLVAFRQAKADPNTNAVLLTGRRGTISLKIRQHLQTAHLYGKRQFPLSHPGGAFFQGHDHEERPDAHSEFYKGDFNRESDFPKNHKGQADQSVLAHKRYIIERLMNNNYVRVDLWEDKEENIKEFQFMTSQLFAKWPNLETIIIHWVGPNQIHTMHYSREQVSK